jgi:hypothetical protein
MKRTTKLYIGGILYTLIFAGASVGIQDRDNDDRCRGSARWAVKVMADEHAEEVVMKPVVTTIEELTHIDTDDNRIGNNTERQELEKQVYRVNEVFITEAILEDDNDIHLVLEDGQGNTMIAEIPDIDCEISKDSEVATRINAARNTFLRYQNTYDQYFFDITGVFFIDKKHGQTGRAPNNAELHPVTGIRKARKIKVD